MLWRKYSVVLGSSFKVTLNTRHLSLLNCMPQVFAQMASLFKSSWTIQASSADYKMQLSANKLHDDDKLSEMSFMYAKSSNGPSTLPCGTPLVTLIGLEEEPPHTTHCVCNNKSQKSSSKHISSNSIVL